MIFVKFNSIRKLSHFILDLATKSKYLTIKQSYFYKGFINEEVIMEKKLKLSLVATFVLLPLGILEAYQKPRLSQSAQLSIALFSCKTASQAEQLIAKGADVNYVDKNVYKGDTPLFYAAYYANKPLILVLVSHGARIDIKNGYGGSPLSAYLKGRKELKKPTDPSIISLLSMITPLQLAENKGYTKIADFLRKQATVGKQKLVTANINTAKEIVYLINKRATEAEALQAIQTMYWPRVGASANTPVTINTSNPYGA